MRELDELLIHFSDCHIDLSPRDYFFRHHDWEREEKEIEGAGADTSIAEETTSAAPAAPEEEEDASEDFSEGDGHPTKSPSAGSLAGEEKERDEEKGDSRNGQQECAKVPAKSFSHFTKAIGNLCTFKCPKCHKVFDSWTRMKTHNVTSPHGTGNRKFSDDFIHKKKLHRCRVCSKDVICDLNFISWHVRAHGKNFNVHNYSKEYGLNIVHGPSVGIRKVTSIKIARQKESERQPRAAPPAKKTTLARKASRAPVAETLKNECVFKCTDCDEQNPSWAGLWYHLVTRGHGVCASKGGFSRAYLLKESLHSCRKCGKEILCDKRMIAWHVKTHALTLQEYVSEYGLTSETASSKKRIFRKNEAPSTPRMRKRPEQHNKSLTASIRTTSNVSNASGHCIIFNRYHESKFESEVTVTREVGNLCLYTCPTCDWSCKNFKDMKAHAAREHEEGKSRQYRKTYMTREVVLHRCRYCETRTACSIKEIYEHFMHQHAKTQGISFSEYRELCNSGEKLPGSEGSSHTRETMTSKKARKKSTNKESANEGKTEEEQDHPASAPGDGDPLSAMPDRHHLTGPLLPFVSNQCDFRCPRCQEMFVSWASLRAHSVEEHGEKAKFRIGMMASAAYHRCRVCSKLLYCDRQLIRRHAVGRHFSAWQEYLDMFPEQQERQDRPPVVPWVDNMCRYKCAKCGQLLIKPSRHNNLQCQSTDCSNSRYRTVNHGCWMCGKEIPCIKNNIWMHVTRRHPSVTWADYQKKCSQPPLVSQSGGGEGGAGETSETAEPLQKDLAASAKNSFRRSDVEGLENRCTFRCDACGELLHCLTDLILHKRRAKDQPHGFSGQGLVKRCVEKKAFFRCPGCGMDVLCDKKLVLLHLISRRHRPLPGRRSSETKQEEENPDIKNKVRPLF